ncbi:MAG: glycoside hydrolase family 99-like domain-containing protein, partial [Alphaproteobacteria bacterium]
LNIFFGGTHLNKKRKLYKIIKKKYSHLLEKKEVHQSEFFFMQAAQENFSSYQKKPPLQSKVKVIAFYLPQFHPFPENDLWWGKGFTEWTNVTKAQPNFANHYQPHYPIHNGYYDLRVPEVMEEQATLAKNYAVSGFNYYFYWFDGKTLMETPLKQMLNNKKMDMSFCLTWANENWTRTWDGMDKDILIEQNHTKEDSIKFIKHIMPYLLDHRYIKINGCPVLCVYRPSLIPNIKEYTDLWREEAKKNGIKDLYLVSIRSFDITPPTEFGFDASAQFPPLQMEAVDITSEFQITNPNFEGRVYDYEKIVESGINEKEPEFKMFRTCMLSWDNTARRQNGSSIFTKFNLTRYRQWLSALCNKVYYDDKYTEEEKLVFINAWNEWAEGTHLEPDKKYGYGYLEATYEVLKNYDEKYNHFFKKTPVKNNNYAIIVHLHYIDLWPEIWLMIKKLEPLKFDLYVSVTSADAAPIILKDCPDAVIRLVDNRGRDVLPFIEILKLISHINYDAVCKIHSKKSPHRIDGSELRQSILDSLLANEKHVKKIINLFKNNEKIGLFASKEHYFPHDEKNMASNLEHYDYLCQKLGTTKQWDSFPAGSMFWFRQKALELLLNLSSNDFNIEHGMLDGTLPHSIERLFSIIVKHSGYKVELIEK